MARNGSILVADHDDLLLTLIKFRLEARGFSVATARSGNEALSLMQHEPFDLVLLEAMLPGGDGFDVLRQIKRNPVLRGVPVVMLTARKREDEVVTALRLGASDYIAKPFIPDELIMRMMRLLAPVSLAA